MKEVLYEGVNNGDKDFSALVSKIKAAGADLVYWGGLHDTGGLILRQMRDQGVKAPLMGGDGITDDEFASIAGPGAEGTLMTFGPDPRKRPEAKDAVAKFRAKNFEPEAYTLYSYAAVQIIKQAAEAAKSLDPKKVAEQMQVRHEVQDRDRRPVLRQEGRRHAPRLRDVRLEEGSPTARSPTPRSSDRVRLILASGSDRSTAQPSMRGQATRMPRASGLSRCSAAPERSRSASCSIA